MATVFKSFTDAEWKRRFVAQLPTRLLTKSDEEGVAAILAEPIDEGEKLNLLVSFLQSRG